MVDSLNGVFTHVSVVGKWREIKTSLRWDDGQKHFSGNFSQQGSKATLFRGFWMCAWMHAHMLADHFYVIRYRDYWLHVSGLLCDVVSQLYFSFLEKQYVFQIRSSNDLACKPGCDLWCANLQHHRMLESCGLGDEHRCCQWKKSGSANLIWLSAWYLSDKLYL